MRSRWIVPEVVQTSAMDCGPAALKSLLEGLGVSVSYGRLREACQTDVDGTSIDTLEEVAVQLGLDAEQVMLPPDHLVLPGAEPFPALVVVRLPNNLTHFVVAWKQRFGLVQVMDPGVGRRWLTRQQFLDQLYVHTMPVPAEDWREWAGSEDFLVPLRRRLSQLGAPNEMADQLIHQACKDPGWKTIARLDAAARMVATLIRCRATKKGQTATEILRAFTARDGDIPASYWSVRAADADESELSLTGAVLVRVSGCTAAAAETDPERAPLSPELVAALAEPPTSALGELWRVVKQSGVVAILALSFAAIIAAAGVVFEALLFRGLLELPGLLGPPPQRLAAWAALLIFLAALLLLELPATSGLLRLGRHLESRFRIAFWRKLPRLSDRYFHSRLTSDMADRCHHVHALRELPSLAHDLLSPAFALVFTTAAIAWLDPPGALWALLVAVIGLALPLALQPFLAERDLRVRTHSGALSRFYLDALLGLVPVRTHRAEPALRSEHESLLVEWARASLGFLRASVAVEGVIAFSGMGLAALLVVNHLTRTGASGVVLLLVYWALRLPALGRQVAQAALRYPSVRNVTLRLVEPLKSPDPPVESTTTDVHLEGDAGVAIDVDNVSVHAGGHTILDEIKVSIAPGSHVAIVGPSGAGKSSLVGLLLGWHTPSRGRVRVDGHLLTAPVLDQLRERTAWIDPTVQIWNRSLLSNLSYGSRDGGALSPGSVVEAAQLRKVLETLPDGFQTVLGEGGALISGGEGQRVRLGRGLMRSGVRLAILDEAFRGLDRPQRRELTQNTRTWWKSATLVCVTHDLAETTTFDRVLVVENGRVVEDGSPESLAKIRGSRYAAMLASESAVKRELWSSSLWTPVVMDEGKLRHDNT